MIEEKTIVSQPVKILRTANAHQAVFVGELREDPDLIRVFILDTNRHVAMVSGHRRYSKTVRARAPQTTKAKNSLSLTVT